MANKIETMPDDTGAKQDTRFRPGMSGNPKGRPRGSRQKLASDFIAALASDFDEHGIAAVEKVRQRSPEIYLKIIGATLPSKLETLLEVNVRHEFSEEFERARSFADAWAIAEKARAMIGVKEPLVIELNPEVEAAWRSDNHD